MLVCVVPLLHLSSSHHAFPSQWHLFHLDATLLRLQMEFLYSQMAGHLAHQDFSAQTRLRQTSRHHPGSVPQTQSACYQGSPGSNVLPKDLWSLFCVLFGSTALIPRRCFRARTGHIVPLELPIRLHAPLAQFAQLILLRLHRTVARSRVW